MFPGGGLLEPPCPLFQVVWCSPVVYKHPFLRKKVMEPHDKISHGVRMGESPERCTHKDVPALGQGPATFSNTGSQAPAQSLQGSGSCLPSG